MDRFTRILISLLVVAALITFWPGRYQYHTIFGGQLVRTNRFTGYTEHYTRHSGWTFRTPETPSNPVDAFGRPAPTVDR